MKISWRTEWPLWLLLAAMFTLAALNWHAVPDRMPLAVARPAWLVVTVLALVASGTIGLVVYSYIVWKRDPDKTPPAGTAPAGDQGVRG
jgi:hypothetical protein